MFRPTSVIVVLLALTSAGCDDDTASNAPAEAKDKVVKREIPETFSEALDALDALASEEDREAYRNDEVDMGFVKTFYPSLYHGPFITLTA